MLVVDDVVLVVVLVPQCCSMRVLWDRIISVTAPGMAPENAPYSQIESFERTVFAECFKGIL